MRCEPYIEATMMLSHANTCRGGYLCDCPGHVHAGEVARPERLLAQRCAYDYRTQAWVTGPAAVALRREQLAEELALVESPQGQRWLDGMRRRGEPRQIAAHVAQAIRAEMTAREDRS